MRIRSVVLVAIVALVASCSTSPPPSSPRKIDVKIKVNKVSKKTKIKKVTAYRKDRVEFQALDGPVTIIVPDGDLVVENAPEKAYHDFGDWFSVKLAANESVVILVPENFPDNRHDPTKKREIWYLVICGEGADAYPGEEESPPRMIIPRKR